MEEEKSLSIGRAIGVGVIAFFLMLALLQACYKLVLAEESAVVSVPIDTTFSIEIDTSNILTIKEEFPLLAAGSKTLDYASIPIHAFVFDTAQHEMDFFYKNEKGKTYRNLNKVISTLKATDKTPLLATNAGIFEPGEVPTGLFTINEKTIQKLNTKKGKGNFFLQPNGVFYMDTTGQVGVLESKTFKKAKIPTRFATQSGPLLLNKGKIHPKFNADSPNKHIRSGVGVMSSGKAVFAISKQPIRFYDFAMFFKEQFQCTDALYLDGIISEMYLSDIDTLVSEQNFAGMITVSAKEL